MPKDKKDKPLTKKQFEKVMEKVTRQTKPQEERKSRRGKKADDSKG